MFHRHHFTYAELAIRRRQYENLKNKLNKKIAEQRERLDDWLAQPGNRKKIYYGIVEDINNTFWTEDEDKKELIDNLEFLRSRESNLLAINKALRGEGAYDLGARAEACKESKSEGLQVLGFLMGVLGAALVVSGLCTLNPVVMSIGATIVLAAYLTYEVGVEKVSTHQSTLFSNLKEKFFPSRPAAATLYQELSLNVSHDEPVLHLLCSK